MMFLKKISKNRSRSALWADNNACADDPIDEKIRNRMAEITGIPRENCEFHQIVKYESGQYHRTHHDYNRHENTR